MTSPIKGSSFSTPSFTGNEPSKQSLFQLIESSAPFEVIKSAIESVPVLDRFHFVNQRDDKNCTPLFLAANAGRKDLVELLLATGAEIDVKNGIGELTALHSAAELGRTEVALLLLQKRADKEALSKKGYRPLYGAALTGKTECVRQLLDAGAEIDAKNGEDKQTALHGSSGKGHSPVVAYLLERGANKDVLTKYGSAPLYVAAMNGKTECVEQLLAVGAEIDAKNGEDKQTALHCAAGTGHSEVLALLLRKGANREALTKGGFRALFAAARYGKTECVRQLLDAGAEINAKNGKDQQTALHCAAVNGHAEVVVQLLQNGANREALTKEGFRSLFWAAQDGKIECVRQLLDAGAEINAKNGEVEQTALHRAAGTGRTQVVALLLEKRADKEALSKIGNRPLFLAATNGRTECVRELLAAGAEINAKNGVAELTALHNAGLNDRREVVALLLERGADWGALNKDGISPLVLAARDGKADVVELIFGRMKSELESLYAKFEQAGCLDLCLYKEFLSRFSYCLDAISLMPNNKDMVGKFNAKIEKLAGLILVQGPLQTALETQINKLTAVLKESDKLEELVKLNQFLNFELAPLISKLMSAIFQPGWIPVARAPLRLSIQRIESLIQECQTNLTIRNQKGIELEHKEQEFDAEEIFSLLAKFGGGVGSQNMMPKESYYNLFGCKMKDFYKCRLYSGKDLRAIGVDLSLFNLLEYQMPKDPKGTIEKLKNRIAEKLALFKSLQEMGYKDEIVLDITRQFEKHLIDPQNLKELTELEIKAGQTLLRLFFSQGIDKIQTFVASFDEKVSLSQIPLSSKLDLFDLRKKMEKRKIDEPAELIEKRSRN